MNLYYIFTGFLISLMVVFLFSFVIVLAKQETINKKLKQFCIYGFLIITIANGINTAFFIKYKENAKKEAQEEILYAMNGAYILDIDQNFNGDYIIKYSKDDEEFEIKYPYSVEKNVSLDYDYHIGIVDDEVILFIPKNYKMISK